MPDLVHMDLSRWGLAQGEPPTIDRLARIEQAISALVRRSELKLRCGGAGCPRRESKRPADRGVDCPQIEACVAELLALIRLGTGE